MIDPEIRSMSALTLGLALGLPYIFPEWVIKTAAAFCIFIALSIDVGWLK